VKRLSIAATIAARITQRRIGSDVELVELGKERRVSLLAERAFRQKLAMQRSNSFRAPPTS
jgi:hypothetical protein